MKQIIKVNQNSKHITYAEQKWQWRHTLGNKYRTSNRCIYRNRL